MHITNVPCHQLANELPPKEERTEPSLQMTIFQKPNREAWNADQWFSKWVQIFHCSLPQLDCRGKAIENSWVEE